MSSELTPRQWALYNYLKERGDDWTLQWIIAAAIPEYKELFGGEYDQPFHDSNARKAITADIRAINDSEVIQKVIISSCKGVKIANEDEANRFVGREINAAVRRLMRAKRKASKWSKDGQMRIVLGNERDTVKAYLDSDKDTGERLRQARLASGWTAKKVVATLQALGFHIDEPLLSRYENGYALPTKSQLRKLCEIYGVSVEYIMGWDVIMAEE